MENYSADLVLELLGHWTPALGHHILHVFHNTEYFIIVINKVLWADFEDQEIEMQS